MLKSIAIIVGVNSPVKIRITVQHCETHFVKMPEKIDGHPDFELKKLNAWNEG